MSPNTYTCDYSKSIKSTCDDWIWSTDNSCSTVTPINLISPSSSQCLTIKYNYSLADLEAAFFEGGGKGPLTHLQENRIYHLPDGSKILIDKEGNYQIEDKEAKVIYRANRIREFSPYINASDMLAKFIEYVATIGIKRGEVLNLPLHLFISWLIIEAAKRDGDNIPADVIPIPNDPLVRALSNRKCLDCGRFLKTINVRNRFLFCSLEHSERYVSKNNRQLVCIN